MHQYQVLHICLPHEDNLGDQLAHQVVHKALQDHGLGCRFHEVDLWELRTQGQFLDNEIDRINEQFDFMVIGAGGMFSPGLINFVFRDPGNWSRIKIPLFFFGVGVIANNTLPNHYAILGPDSEAPLVKALQAASLVSVRDMRTWLTAAKVLPDHRERLFLTGCPTIFYTGNGHEDPGTAHSLALNIPFNHGVCSKYSDSLLQVVALLLNHTDSIKWICHSSVEKTHADEVVKQFDKKIEVLYPRDIQSVREAYMGCELALVTKAHAALFCLANLVPFGFFSYDMKCDALMEMIADFPGNYICHIETLPRVNIAGMLSRLLYNLQRDAARLKASQRVLVRKLRSEFEFFMKALIEKVA
ncbi:MAG: polysaccharide pyruvyl transferase family protein [Deltaproteobacteria bacterium]|nr:polysaccharide pyruvyl transferase family protein [Deltaproteobacteria bacterium]